MKSEYTAKYPQLFFVVLLSCIVPNYAIDLYMCDSNNYTSAKFESNLDTVLNNLVKNTSASNGFSTSIYGQSPYIVYGLLQCWGDVTVEECLSCSQDGNTSIRQLCGSAIGGRAWRSKCFIRYESYSFVGELDTNTRIVFNTGKITDEPDVFSEAVKGLFRNLSDEALRSPIRYSSGSTTTSTLYPIYSLVQCWRDLASVEDCKICLTNAIRDLLDVTVTNNGTFRGGVAGSGSCVARYETYSFFHHASPPPPPQLLSPPD